MAGSATMGSGRHGLIARLRGGLRSIRRQRSTLNNVLNTLSVVLVLMTVLRMSVVVATNPITGYANNLDFFRQSSCVGVWENYPGKGKVSDNLAGPVNDLIFDGMTMSDWCLRSSDNFFPWMATRLHKIGDHVQLREVGAWKVVIATLLMLFCVAQPVGAGLRASIALAFYLVLGDLAVLTYFNTLYVDSSGIVLSLALTTLIVGISGARRAPNAVMFAALAGCILALGILKPQYSILTFFLGLAASLCIAICWQRKPQAAALLGITVLTPLLFIAVNASSTGVLVKMNRVNRADTILQAVLIHAPEPASALEWLGLPPACSAAIGKTGYDLGIQQHTLCPEIDGVNRIRLLPLFLTQPATFIEPMYIAIIGSRPSYLILNHFEQPKDVASRRFRFLHESSLSTWLTWLTDPEYVFLIVSICLLGIGVLIISGGAFLLGYRSVTQRQLPILAFVSLGGTLSLYALVSSIFGDGYQELARHTVCILVGIALIGAAVLRTVLGLAAWALKL